MSGFGVSLPLVSVALVAHDAEPTLVRALESIRNQSLGHIELVAVDAGSHDRTGQILDSAAERDPAMTVLHVDGADRRAALDVALSHARGRYVTFFDQDGWAERSLLEDLVRRAEDDSLDLVVSGVSLVVGTEGRPDVAETVANEPAALYPTQHDFASAAWHLLGAGQLLPLGGKLFSRARIEREGLSFAGGGTGIPSDHPFVCGYLSHVERVAVTGRVGYHVQRMVAPKPTNVADELARINAEHDGLVGLYRAWGLEGDAASMDMLQSRYLEQLVACIEDVCAPGHGGRGILSPEVRRTVGGMIQTDRAQLAAQVARPRTSSAKALATPIRSGNVPLTVLQASVASLLRRAGGPTVLADMYL